MTCCNCYSDESCTNGQGLSELQNDFDASMNYLASLLGEIPALRERLERDAKEIAADVTAYGYLPDVTLRASVYKKVQRLNKAEGLPRPLGKMILDLPVEENHTKATTVREYIKEFLVDAWVKFEINSDRQWDRVIIRALIRGNVVKGRIAERSPFESERFDGISMTEIDEVMSDAIRQLH